MFEVQFNRNLIFVSLFEKKSSRWSEFMSDPLLSISQIRQNGFEGKIDCLRSLYWRIFLGQLPLLSPNNQASDELLSWTIALEQCRLNWEIFRKKFFRGPDGKFVDGCSSSNQKLSIHKSFTINRLNLNRTDTSPLLDLVVNNPLSQHEANPWNVWLDDLEMRKVIQQDVVRTFPDIAYFHQPHIQALLTNVLHAYCKVNKDLGYRQGMHEILAVLVRTLDQDSLLSPKDQPPDLMHQVLSREFLEHDSYSLFCLLMNSIKPWYHSHSNIKLPRLSSNFSSDFPSSALGFIPIQISNSLSHSESLKSSETILVPQIVEKCFEIFEIYLRQIDFELWDHLSRLEIEPQLWGIRWIRLLFTREFNYDESLKIWDAILAEDSSRLRLVDFFCLAMLLRIRDELLSSDSNQCLHLLLKYPRTNNDGDHRVEVLVYQALLLSRFPSPATASLIHLQNLDLQASASSASETNYKIDFSDRALANKVSRNSISLEGDFAKGKEINSQRSTSLPSEHRFSIGALGRSFYSNPENLGRDGGSLNSAFWQRKNNLLIAENVSQKNSHLVQATPSKGKDHGQVLELKSEEREEELLKELKSLHQFNQDIGEVVGLCVEALQRKISRSTGPVETSEGLSLGVLKHLQQVIKTDACSGIDPCVLRPLKDHLTSIATPIFQSKPHLDGSSDQNLPPKSRIIKSQSTEFLCGQSLPKPSFDLTQSEILGKSKRPGSDRTGGCTNSEKNAF
ncbi:rab-GTPase-TBC domain-containing protein [Phakopsora pachyrhizi]|uniref:Rab-GTPase-TBC domain-containing protein n=1 Tax=Phakopsora pachyrhizi TaxID=170000 RepID=A0AAV0BQ71_PHAPC|nr:rab-GTPase-TBC domain-containing protein [Phakopsora pachyrhizi]